MSDLYYSATHSSGRVHLRKSAGRIYTHAIVTANVGGQSFAGRLDLARNALASAYDSAAWELVEAKAITKAEFTTLTKAGKQTAKAVFMGQKFSKSRDAAGAPFVCAVGRHLVAHTTRHPLNVEAYTAQLGRIQARLDAGTAYGHDAQLLESVRASLARGYAENDYQEQIDVSFHLTEQDALETIARNHRAGAWRTAELLALV